MIINIDQKEERTAAEPPKPADLTASTVVVEGDTQASLRQLVFSKLGISNSTNPFVCISHMLFKGLGIFFYLFSGLTFDSATVFLLVAIFGVLDFWVVKNISGRCSNQVPGRPPLVVHHRREGRGEMDVREL